MATKKDEGHSQGKRPLTEQVERHQPTRDSGIAQDEALRKRDQTVSHKVPGTDPPPPPPAKPK